MLLKVLWMRKKNNWSGELKHWVAEIFKEMMGSNLVSFKFRDENRPGYKGINTSHGIPYPLDTTLNKSL